MSDNYINNTKRPLLSIWRKLNTQNVFTTIEEFRNKPIWYSNIFLKK